MFGTTAARRFPLPVIILLVAAIALSACARLEEAGQAPKIKGVVASYNQGLIGAAKTGHVWPMRGLAAKGVLIKLYYWIAAWRDSGVYMDARLKDLSFDDISISGQTARALTSEHWVYEYRNIKNGKIAFPLTGVDYRMEYDLQKTLDGNWMIAGVKIKSEKKLAGGNQRPKNKKIGRASQ